MISNTVGRNPLTVFLRAGATSAPGRYVCHLHRSIDEVDADEWRETCRHSGTLSLDPRFLKAVERSFSTDAEFWYALYRDDEGQAVASACFSKYNVDGALMAPSIVQNAAAGVRRLWPGFFKYNILLCGLPVSTCDSTLSIAPRADVPTLLASLNETALSLAKESGCWLISFKEFGPELAAQMDGLRDLGFLKARSVYAYDLEGEFGSFSSYVSSRSKRTRANIRKAFKSFEEAGLTVEQLRGADGVDRLFTPEVHRLYLNVLDRAKVRFEVVPLEFFQELARQLPEESQFTILRQDERVVGFCCGIAAGEQHVMLFCGLDYDVNRDANLYFNVIYRGLEQGLVPGVRLVHIGAAADEFKQRMGCRGSWLSVYVKAVDSLKHLVLRSVFGWLFDTRDGTNAPPPAGTAYQAADAEPGDADSPKRRAA